MNSRRLLEEQSSVCSSLVKSDSMKKFRFECQKGINIPVNAISGLSREHLVDKYEKLYRLLDGKPPVQANKHPEGIAFCKLTLAKKFVVRLPQFNINLLLVVQFTNDLYFSLFFEIRNRNKERLLYPANRKWRSLYLL